MPKTTKTVNEFVWCVWTPAELKQALDIYECKVKEQKINANRDVNILTMRLYERQMRDGSFDYEAQTTPIMIDADGALRAGRHRAKAAIEAGVDLLVPTIFNATEAQIARQDTNKNRSAKDSTAMVRDLATSQRIRELTYIQPRTVDAAVKALIYADCFLNDGKFKAFVTTPHENATKQKQTISIFEALDACSSDPQGTTHNLLTKQYIVAAFVFTYGKINMHLWGRMAKCLTNGNEFTDSNEYVQAAFDRMVRIHSNNKGAASNPKSVWDSFRLFVGCISCAVNSKDIKKMTEEKLQAEGSAFIRELGATSAIAAE